MDRFAVSILFAFAITLGACGETDTSASSDHDTASVSVSLVFPAGALPDCPTCAAAPSYVTSATLTISGGLLTAPMTQEIPLDTGVVEGKLAPGVYTFAVTVVTTDFGTFTGISSATLASGRNDPVAIRLAVNAPPTIDSLTFAPSSPLPGERVTFTAIASDKDNDPLTYTWNATGGTLTPADATARWSTGLGGSFTISLAVADGKGGSATASTDVTVPTNGAPAVTAVGGIRGVTLTWPAVTGATGYNVYWGVTPGVTTTTGTKVANVASGWELTQLADAHSYTFIVTALHPGGLEVASTEVTVSTTPAAPTPSCAAGYRQLTLSWAAVTGATSYKIYWADSAGVTTASSGITPAGLAYTHTGVPVHQTRSYRVASVNASGVGSLSTEVSCLEQTGLTWTNRGALGAGFVAHNGTTFLHAGNPAGGGSHRTSTDGITWSGATLFAGVQDLVSALTWTGTFFIIGNQFVASPTEQYFTSADGVNWSGVAQIGACGGACPHITGLVGSGDTILAGLSDGTHAAGVYTSGTNSVAWGAIGNTTPAVATTLRHGASDGTTFVLLSSAGDFVTYNAGVWARPLNNGHNMYDAAYGAGLFVAVGSKATAGFAQIWTSPTGATWTSRANSVNQTLRDIVWTGNVFFAVGASGTFSFDGVTWEAPVALPNNFAYMAYDGTKFVAVDVPGNVYTSP